MPKKLTEQQVRAFGAEGYCAPVDVLTPDQAANFRARFEAAEARYPEEINATSRSNAHYVLTCLDELVHHPAILDAVEDLIGPDILAWGTVLFIKEPHDPGFVSWHQDATYWGIEPHEGVTAWLALSPATEEAGCMQVMPGSHIAPVRPHRDTFGADNILTRGQVVQDAEEDRAVAMALLPGQMSLHHVRAIHGSQPNRSHDRRIGLAIQAYFPPSARQTKGEDAALLVRGHDRYGHFVPGRRPKGDMLPEDREFRRWINGRWTEILYDGAAERRAF